MLSFHRCFPQQGIDIFPCEELDNLKSQILCNLLPVLIDNSGSNDENESFPQQICEYSIDNFS